MKIQKDVIKKPTGILFGTLMGEVRRAPSFYQWVY